MAKKPTITTLTSGFNSTTTLNNNFTALRNAFDNTLSLDGSTPNAMNADLDMNSNDILNVGEIDVQGLTIDGVAVYPGSAQLATTYATQSYTGNGSTTVYSMGFNPGVKANVNVYIDGVHQNQDAFNISGTSLTFTAAPPLNSAIEIKVPVNVTSLTNTDSSQIVYNQGGTGAQDRSVQSRLRDFVSVKDFGAVGDGVTDDTAAIQVAVAATAGTSLLFPDGVYKTSSNVTISVPAWFVGGIIKPASGTTVTFGSDVSADCVQIVDLSSGGSLKFTKSQDVFPEWVGNGPENVRTVMKASATGSITRLRGVEYEIDYVHFLNHPDSEDGIDDGKCIVGATYPGRFTAPAWAGAAGGASPSDRQFFGSVLKCVDNTVTHVVLIDAQYTVLSRTWAGNRLSNLMIDANNNADHCIGIGAVKDVSLENVLCLRATSHGIVSNAGATAAGNNQIKFQGDNEIYYCGGDGVNGSFGDAQWNIVRAHHNGGNGINLTGGYLHANVLFAYSNDEAGILWNSERASRIDLVRVEDNRKQGLYFISGSESLSIGSLQCADNGSLVTATTAQRVGVLNEGEGLSVGRFVAPYRASPEFTSNELYSWYDAASCKNGSIDFFDVANYGLTGVAGYRGMLIDSAARGVSGTRVGSRRVLDATRAAVETGGAYEPVPDVYDTYRITAVGANLTISNTAAASSPHGSIISFEFHYTASVNVFFSGDYFAEDGTTTVGSNNHTSGDILEMRFRRVRDRWQLIGPVTVT